MSSLSMPKRLIKERLKRVSKAHPLASLTDFAPKLQAKVPRMVWISICRF